MYFSLNCLLLGNGFNNSFSVNIDIIFDSETMNLELWKVDGKKFKNNENKLEGFFTKDVIKNDLGGEYMESLHFLSRYFIKNKKIYGEAIHIIVQVPATTKPSSINELMVIKSSDKTPDFSSSMPLKERNMESAIKSTSKNFEQSFYTEHSVAKSTLQFLICCGAPDIDRSFLSVKYCTFNACKTRYGVELFNHLKNNPEDLKDPFFRRPVPDPDFLSIYLDFRRDVELGIYNNNLTADSVIALRIAFKFFIDGESYEMDFNGFRQKIYGLFNVN
ncbi:hypothetical protein RhiirC2_777735 [Rhizophagus irregularis]|uniref:Uncharacterized protein n=1 Tax=Rhizophagus irregularis TaxID=588596 RepID=A0A2N1NDL0_9GLOM|nr:hypothetical protein RhiirC2_777735 [Rhizophagus irregularis]